MNYTKLSHAEYKKLVARTMSYNFYIAKNVNIVQVGERLSELHCAMGLSTEVTDELLSAILKPRTPEVLVNIGEEIADAFWYTTNLENILGLDFTTTQPYLFVHDPLNLVHELIIASGKILDIYKKPLFYDSAIKHEALTNNLMLVHTLLTALASDFGLDVEVLKAKNINKLWVRFPDKFDSVKAQEVNRDLKKEYAVLA